MLERLSDVDRAYVRALVARGVYTSEIEVVRDAVRRMREADEQKKLETLRALVMSGHEQALQGNLIPYTSAFVDTAMKRALENQAKKVPIKDEVKS